MLYEFSWRPGQFLPPGSLRNGMDSIGDVCRIEHMLFGEPFLIKREVCWSCFICLHVFRVGWLSRSSALTVVWCVCGLLAGATGSTVHWIRWRFICVTGHTTVCFMHQEKTQTSVVAVCGVQRMESEVCWWSLRSVTHQLFLCHR